MYVISFKHCSWSGIFSPLPTMLQQNKASCALHSREIGAPAAAGSTGPTVRNKVLACHHGANPHHACSTHRKGCAHGHCALLSFVITAMIENTTTPTMPARNRKPRNMLLRLGLSLFLLSLLTESQKFPSSSSPCSGLWTILLAASDVAVEDRERE